MGYKWKYKRKNDESVTDFNDLMIIVNKIYNLNILEVNKRQNMVFARMTFSKILKDRGYTYKEIGNFLNKQHATIIHYERNFGFLAKHSPSFLEKFVEARDCFLEKRPAREMVTSNANKRLSIKGLKNEIEKIILQKQIIAIEVEKYRRIKDIIEIIDSRTPTGKEEFIKTKINQMFNTIVKYE